MYFNGDFCYKNRNNSKVLYFFRFGVLILIRFLVEYYINSSPVHHYQFESVTELVQSVSHKEMNPIRIFKKAVSDMNYENYVRNGCPTWRHIHRVVYILPW